MFGKTLFFLFNLFTLVNLSFAQSTSDLLGRDCKRVDSFETSNESIEITYQGKNNLSYGSAASANPRPFQLIVFHWPGSGCDIQKAVNYGQNTDSARGAMFGYHFYIDPSGKIIQGAPMFKRTNHVDSKNGRGTINYDNNSSLGISLVCSEKGTGAKQLETAVKLGNAIQVAYGIPSYKIFGHGEIQTTRDLPEGRPAAIATRNSTPKGEYKINYTLENGSKAVCVVDGSVPAGCSGDLCNVSIPASSNSALDSILNKLGIGSKQIYSDNNDPGDTSILQDRAFNLKNNPTPAQEPLVQPLQRYYPTPQPIQQPVATTTQNSCTNIFIASEKAKLTYYLDGYNKSYASSFGAWNIFLNTQVTSYSFEAFFAKFYVRKINESYLNLKACNLTVIIN